MCKKPYMRRPNTTRLDTIVDDNARLAATPFPCGQCLHCRINKAREWQHRLLLELAVSNHAAFVTLTYDDESLPKGGNLDPKHLTAFLKALRYRYPEKFRYFAVGEYGEKTWRPHYHLALFGVPMTAEYVVQNAWDKGFTQTGELNKASAGYITGYCTKKLTNGKDPYVVAKLDGRHPEFMRSSRRGGGIGIGAIRELAERIQGSRYRPDIIVRSINHGKKSKPLGRYLTNKLCDAIGITEQETKAEFWNYTEKIFQEHMNELKGTYYDKLRDSTKAKRLSQEKKHKIYTQGRTL